MNTVSIGEYHGLRVGSALLSIVAGCIIIGVSKDCDADAVGGIFLGAGGLVIEVEVQNRHIYHLIQDCNPNHQLKIVGLLISVYPFIRAWFNFHHILPNIGSFRVHPMTTNSNPAPEQPVATLTREGTQSQLNVERSKSRMGTFVETIPTAAEGSQDDGPSTDIPDILGRRKFKSSDQDP